LILGEPITARTLAAAAVIVVSVAVITTPHGRSTTPKGAPPAGSGETAGDLFAPRNSAGRRRNDG
jgi:hypothetical protein